MAFPHLACFALAAVINDLPPRALATIHAVEGGRVGTVSRNANGSEDLGVMQINTLWLRPLATATGMQPADVRRALVDNACFNIAMSGVILKVYLAEARGDLMRAIGFYHSHTPVHHDRYRERIERAAQRLFDGEIAPAGARR